MDSRSISSSSTSTTLFDANKVVISNTMKSSLFITATVLSIGSSAAFTTPSCGGNVRPSSTSLSMAKSNDSARKTFAASAIAAAYILTGVVSADAALAMDGPSSAVPSFTDSSSVILAGRSGGRAGKCSVGCWRY